MQQRSASRGQERLHYIFLKSLEFLQSAFKKKTDLSSNPKTSNNNYIERFN